MKSLVPILLTIFSIPVLAQRSPEVLTRLDHCSKKPESIQRYPYFLSEAMYCGTCGEKMGGKSAHGRNKKHPYYEHGRRTKIQSGLAEKIYNCDPHRISAMKAEELVWDDLENLLSGNLSDELLATVLKKKEQISFTHEIERLKNKTYSINSQVEALTLRLAELPKEVSAAPICKQMEKLEIDKRELDEKILKLKDAELGKEIPTDAISYQNLLGVLRDEKASGLTTAKKQKKTWNRKVGCPPKPLGNFGGGTQWIDEHRIPLDFIELSSRTPARIIEKCAPLYEKGLFLRDIEERTGIAKSTIRETFT
jgi:hypothetical protein